MSSLSESESLDPIVGQSAAIARLRELIARVAPSTVPVLLIGETGSGKELVAQALHRASGRRGPCVAFNVCAFADGTFEDAVFGHVRGAFTGAIGDRLGLLAEANGGTAFFDEIGGLALALQMKLLRAIETKTFRPVGGVADRRSDFRLISATNDDLESLARDGRFRADLAHRLRGVVIRVPPLRERPEDIPLLARHFVRAAVLDGAPAARLSETAIRALSTHSWPGNVRELKQVIDCAALLADRGVIERADVLAALGQRTRTEPPEDFARRRLVAELVAARGEIASAARELTVHQATLYRRMQRYGITRLEIERELAMANGCAERTGHASHSPAS